MKERPIIFSGELIPDILDGFMPQTRRVIKPQPPPFYGDSVFPSPTVKGAWNFRSTKYKRAGLSNLPLHCPFQVGMRLWVKETWALRVGDIDDPIQVLYRADNAVREIDPDSVHWEPWGERPGFIPSALMPRWASRIRLEVGSRLEVVRAPARTADDYRSEWAKKAPKWHGSLILPDDELFHWDWDFTRVDG